MSSYNWIVWLSSPSYLFNGMSVMFILLLCFNMICHRKEKLYLLTSERAMNVDSFNLILTHTFIDDVLAGCWLTLQAQSKKVSLLYTNAEASHKSLFASQYRHWLSILRRKNRSFNKRKQILSLSVFKAINSSEFLFLDWSDLLPPPDPGLTII